MNIMHIYSYNFKFKIDAELNKPLQPVYSPIIQPPGSPEWLLSYCGRRIWIGIVYLIKVLNIRQPYIFTPHIFITGSLSNLMSVCSISLIPLPCIRISLSLLVVILMYILQLSCNKLTVVLKLQWLSVF